MAAADGRLQKREEEVVFTDVLEHIFEFTAEQPIYSELRQSIKKRAELHTHGLPAILDEFIP